MASLPAMPCFDPWPWQPQHPGGAIWLREGMWGEKTTREGLETIKMRCASLIVLSIKVLVVRPQQDFQPRPSHQAPASRWNKYIKLWGIIKMTDERVSSEIQHY